MSDRIVVIVVEPLFEALLWAIGQLALIEQKYNTHLFIIFNIVSWPE